MSIKHRHENFLIGNPDLPIRYFSKSKIPLRIPLTGWPVEQTPPGERLKQQLVETKHEHHKAEEPKYRVSKEVDACMLVQTSSPSAVCMQFHNVFYPFKNLNASSLS